MGAAAAILPAVILADPQLGENIGAAARAMANFGLSDLRLVRPRDPWPNASADAMAAGAETIVRAARVFDGVEAAAADLNFVIAATARDRSMAKPVLTPAEAVARLRGHSSAGRKTGLLFGGERSGLQNDDVALADCVVTIPADPGFTSLNLAQAVLLLGYEWFKSSDATPARRIDHGLGVPATKAELFQLFEHLEDELDKSGFLFPPDKRPSMSRNLRAMLTRAELTDQEVRTLRGVIVALTGAKGKRRE